MLFHNLNIAGLLSFGPQGIDLPLQQLNVFIGPNGSGKSNLLEVLSLLRAAPTRLPAPVKDFGGIGDWLWQGTGVEGRATINALIDNPGQTMRMRHTLEIGAHGDRFEVLDERIENERPHDGQTDSYFFYRYQQGRPLLADHAEPQRRLKRESVRPEDSILSQVRDPERYPGLYHLQDSYERIRLYRNWTFGTGAPGRRQQSSTGSGDILADNGENLTLVLNRIRNSPARKELLDSLQVLMEGTIDIRLDVSDGNIQLMLEESTDRPPIPASRLSDGTLRYLYLVAALLQPIVPSLIAIEEPELGLHPDLMHHVCRLLLAASRRTQLIVTTHSRDIVDALGEAPESLIICERHDGQSVFERANPEQLKAWLENYTLGGLWSDGVLGGNRW